MRAYNSVHTKYTVGIDVRGGGLGPDPGRFLSNGTFVLATLLLGVLKA